MKSKQEILIQIRRFIVETFPLARQQSLTDDDALLGSGIVDSLGILELVAFVEQKFDIVVDVEELQPENFQNISMIASFVASKVRGEFVLEGE